MVTFLERRICEWEQHAHAVILMQRCRAPHLVTHFVYRYTVHQYMGSASFASATNIHLIPHPLSPFLSRNRRGMTLRSAALIILSLSCYRPSLLIIAQWCQYVKALLKHSAADYTIVSSDPISVLICGHFGRAVGWMARQSVRPNATRDGYGVGVWREAARRSYRCGHL